MIMMKSSKQQQQQPTKRQQQPGDKADQYRASLRAYWQRAGLTAEHIAQLEEVKE